MKSWKFHSASLIGLIVALLIASPVYAQTASAEKEDENVPGDRITIHQLKRKLEAKEEVVIIDNRKGSSYIGSTVKIKGAIHITVDELEAKMKELPKNREIVTYCT
jgi:predicted sulfurtransferase